MTIAALCLGSSDSAGRLSALNVRLVDLIDQLRRVLRAPELLAQTHREARAQAEQQELGCEGFSERDVMDALCSLDPIWDHLFPEEQTRIVQLLVKQVDVYPGRAELRIRAEGLASLVAELREEQEVAV